MLSHWERDFIGIIGEWLIKDIAMMILEYLPENTIKYHRGLKEQGMKAFRLREGEWKQLNQRGDVVGIIPYQRNQIHGVKKMFDAHGRLISCEEYGHGRPHGITMKSVICMYESHHARRYFHDIPLLHIVQQYEHGKPNGWYETWDKSIVDMIYVEAKLYTRDITKSSMKMSWDLNGQVLSFGYVGNFDRQFGNWYRIDTTKCKVCVGFKHFVTMHGEGKDYDSKATEVVNRDQEVLHNAFQPYLRAYLTSHATARKRLQELGIEPVFPYLHIPKLCACHRE